MRFGDDDFYHCQFLAKQLFDFVLKMKKKIGLRKHVLKYSFLLLERRAILEGTFSEDLKMFLCAKVRKMCFVKE